MSFGYLKQNAVMKDQDYQRFTVSMNGDITPVKPVTVGLSMNGSVSTQNYGIVRNFDNTIAKDSYGQAMGIMPWVPAYNEDGTLLVGSASGQARTQHHQRHQSGSERVQILRTQPQLLL